MSIRKMLEENLTELGLQDWKIALEGIQLVNDEELEDLKLIYLDSRFSYLLDKDGKKLLKQMRIFDGIAKEEHTPVSKITLDGYEMQRVALETKQLPRGDFEGQISFLDYFDKAGNLEEGKLKHWIKKFMQNNGNVENDGNLRLYIFPNGLSFYAFESGGNHRTYVSMLFAPLVKKFTTSFTKAYISEGKYLNQAIDILEKYRYIKKLYKEASLKLKVETAPTYHHYNVLIYSDSNEKGIFLNVNTTSFDQVINILKADRNNLILKAKRLNIGTKISKHPIGKFFNFFIEPAGGENYRHNYRLSVVDKKYYLKE